MVPDIVGSSPTTHPFKKVNLSIDFLKNSVIMSFALTSDNILFSGCGSAWLERLVWDQEVAGSNPVTPIHFFNMRV